jgi:cytochrome c-type biogenesis protein CcmF
MTPEIGKLLLHLSLALSLISGVLPFLYPKNSLVILRRLWLANFTFTVGAFFCLIYCYIISDFSVLNVFYNSHTSKPLIYRISGAWGNHEGSMMLWLSAIAFFSVLFSYFAKGDEKIISYTLAVQGILSAIFVSFVIFTSSPFVRLFPAPTNGLGLNPILQDIGLAMHPPMLYMGYVGFSIAFSAAIAALIVGKVDALWARLIRPWVLLSWSFLTIGVGLGSWWAYRELGWGGYWFWDPVENASLMPWLAATALIHTSIVTDKTQQLKVFSLLLAILTFSLSLVGTFIVRSGMITSVHSFAQDPRRGMFILGILGLIVGSSLLLYLFRAHRIAYTEKTFSFLSRTIFILLNNLLLLVAVVVVLVGTLYPLILELITGEKISVGAPYFNSLIGPIAILSAMICAIGSDLNWERTKISQLIKTHFKPLLSSLVLTIGIVIYFQIHSLQSILGILASLWLIIHLTIHLYIKKPNFKSGFYAMYLAHMGFACLVLSVSLNHALVREFEKPMEFKEQAILGEFKIKFNGIDYQQGPNYVSRVGIFEIILPNHKQIYLYPETRLFLVEQQQTTEAAIHHHLLYDLYVTIGEIDDKERIMVRVFVRPMIGWIWFSCILIFFGGVNGLVLQLIRRTA